MPSLSTDKKFKRIVADIKQDKNVLAFWLDGSGGKNMMTKYSDYDAKIIVKDELKKEYLAKYANIDNQEIDITIMTVDELTKHAEFGTDMEWDRYNFAHLKDIFDRTGQIQKIIDDKAKLSKKEQELTINKALDAFINQVYRLEKNIRDGNLTAAKFEPIEAIPLFLEAIFALEGRLRPYNKYLAWELDNYPLEKFPWGKGELVEMLLSVIEQKQLQVLHELFVSIKPIFKSEGYVEVFDSWKGRYKVG